MFKKVVAITGASSGIGKSLAEVFSQAGYPLLLMARNTKAMQDLNLPNAVCCEVDVTNIQTLQQAIDEAEKSLGPIDCLVNNAGFAASGDFIDQALSNKQKMIDVNVSGVINGIDAVLPKMRNRKVGTIINVSSIADRKTRPNLAVYAASKAAVASLTESLRVENAKYGIRFCNVAPAKIRTPMLISAGIDQNQIIEPDELAKAILWIYEQPQHICIRDIVFTPTFYEA